MPNAVNAGYLADPRSRAYAEGQVTLSAHTSQIPADDVLQNGGMAIEETRYYGDDTALIRVVAPRRNGRPLSRLDQLSSPWWLTREMFDWMVSRVGAGPGLQAFIRYQLLLPEAWSEASRLVAARPRRGITLAAWRGRPREIWQEKPVDPANTAPMARRMAVELGVPETWMYQLFIPGIIPGTSNGARWLEHMGTFDINPARGPNGMPVFPPVG